MYIYTFFASLILFAVLSYPQDIIVYLCNYRNNLFLYKLSRLLKLTYV